MKLDVLLKWKMEERLGKVAVLALHFNKTVSLPLHKFKFIRQYSGGRPITLKG